MANRAGEAHNRGQATVTGRAADFERFLREQMAALAGFLRRRLPSEEDAQDVAQESMLRMLRYQSTEPPQSWKPLLYRVATNAACDHARRRASHYSSEHVELDADELVADTPPPEQQLMEEQEQAMIEAAIMQLSPRCREAFLLHRMEGMTYAQISEHVGLSESSVQKYISRAVVQLAAAGRAYQAGEWPAGTLKRT